MTFPLDDNLQPQDARADVGLRETSARLGRQSRARLADAKLALGRTATAAKTRSAMGARVAVTKAKQRPVSTGLLLAGAVAGGAVLLNPALRRLVLANAPLLLRSLRGRMKRS